jgi:hypothetical protein
MRDSHLNLIGPRKLCLGCMWPVGHADDCDYAHPELREQRMERAAMSIAMGCFGKALAGGRDRLVAGNGGLS